MTPKALAVLSLLVENAGDVVSKQQLLDTVWAGSFVEEASLTKNISILRKILSEGLPECEVIRTISKRGYQLTIEVSAAPAATDTSPTAPVEPNTRARRLAIGRGRLRWGLIAASGGISLSLGLWSLRAYIAPQSARRAVAVISFHDLSGKPENVWLSRALSEMLTTELDADNTLRTLPGDVTARMRIDLALPDQNGFSAETLTRIRRAAECDYVISGSYLSIGGNLRLDVRVQDTGKPDSSAAMSFTGAEKNLPEVAAKAGEEIRKRFGVPQLSLAEEAIVRASLPTEPETRKNYAEALERLRVFDPAGARTLLDRVVIQDPGFASGHLELSTALSQLGYDSRAREETRRAFELAGSLPKEERLAIEARYHEAAGQWEKAATIYSGLWTFFPDDPEYGLALARVQSRAGKGARADQILNEMRKAASPATGARIALTAAEAHNANSEYSRASLEFAHAIQAARKLGFRLLEGRAQAGQALAFDKMGQSAKSHAAWQEAIRICSELGDSGCVADAQNNEAVQLTSGGDDEAALAVVDQVLILTRRTGNRGQEARALDIRGLLLLRSGDFKGAQTALEDCLAIAREISEARLSATALHRLGEIASRIGDGAAALRFYEQETQAARQTDNQISVAAALDSVGRLKQRQGDLAGARRDLEESLRLKRQGKIDNTISATLSYLAALSKNQGDLNAARKLRTEECALIAPSNRKNAMYRCQLSLAEIDLLEGQAREAAAVAKSVAEGTKAPNPAAEAYRILALSYLVQGDTGRAREAILNAQSLAAKSKDLVYTTPVTIAAGRIESALGHKREASILFLHAMEQAKRADTMSLILETRLAVAEAAAKRDDKAARKQLADLVADSTQRGYGLYAGRAQKLLANLQ